MYKIILIWFRYTIDFKKFKGSCKNGESFVDDSMTRAWKSCLAARNEHPECLILKKQWPNIADPIAIHNNFMLRNYYEEIITGYYF